MANYECEVVEIDLDDIYVPNGHADQGQVEKKRAAKKAPAKTIQNGGTSRPSGPRVNNGNGPAVQNNGGEQNATKPDNNGGDIVVWTPSSHFEFAKYPGAKYKIEEMRSVRSIFGLGNGGSGKFLLRVMRGQKLLVRRMYSSYEDAEAEGDLILSQITPKHKLAR